MSRVVIGVDAGASKIALVALDASGVERSAQGEPANLRLVGVALAAERIAASIAQVSGDDSASAIFVGAAGAGDHFAAEALRAELAARFPQAHVAVSNDAYIALRAGIREGDALALVVGTGAIGYAAIGSRQHRVGGYGHLLGDEGSGFAIGSAGVRLLMRAYDGRVPFDPMLESIAQAFNASCAQDVVTSVHAQGEPVRELAAVAPIVVRFADAGERSAAKIVQAAALELFDMLKALTRIASVGSETLPIIFAGGLLRCNSLLTFLLETRISNEFPNLEIRKNVPEPQYGALACAQKLLED